MDNKTKLELLNIVESYWDLLPPEVQEKILNLKESQELIDWREGVLNRTLCKEIRMYRVLRERWQIGHIRCQPIYCKPGEVCECLRVYGHYPDLQGVIQKIYLGISVEHAIAFVAFRRATLDRESNGFAYQVANSFFNWMFR